MILPESARTRPHRLKRSVFRTAIRGFRAGLFALAVGMVSAVCRAEAPAYSITDLGNWWPTAINDSGQMAGAISVEGTPYAHAVIYDGGVLHDLGTLGGSTSVAYDINDSGQVVGFSFLTGNQNQHAFLFSGGVMRDLGTLGGPDSVAFGINSQGQVVGAAQYPGGRPPIGTNQDAHPFLFDGTKMHDLGTFGGSWGVAFSINDAGQVAGAATTSVVIDGQIYNSGWHAFLGDIHGKRDLGYVFNLFNSPPGRVINDAGQLANAAFIRPHPGPQDTLVPVTLQGIPVSINDLGHKVGQASIRTPTAAEPDPPTHAMLYQNDAAVDLNDLILPASGWELLEAHGINNHGQIIGSGKLNGEPRAFLLTPVVDLLTIAPQAPSDLWANRVSDAEVRLTWSDHSNNETAFAIWRKVGAGDWVRIATVPPNIRAFVDREPGADSTTIYRVRAINPAGASDWSNEARPVPPPAAPVNLHLDRIERTRIELAWTDNSDTETAVAVWRKQGSGDWGRIAVLAPDSTRYADRSVSPNTQYDYRVRAINQSGASAWSDVVSGVTPPLPPDRPQNLTVIAISSSQIDLNWAGGDERATGIAVWRQTDGGNWERVAVIRPYPSGMPFSPFYPRYVDQSGIPGHTYTYRVRGHNTVDVSEWSNEASIIQYPALGAPQELTFAPFDRSQAVLTWQDRSSGESGFSIWRSIDGGPWERVGLALPNEPHFTASSLESGRRYAYRVRAHSDTDVSGWSNEVSFTWLP